MDKYNEALERAKKAIIDCGDNEGLKKMIKEIFPELKESEDEKIRKALLKMMQDTPFEEVRAYGVNKVDTLAWLEKQGEQKQQEWDKHDIEMIEWLIRCCEKEHEELCNDRYGHQDIVSDLKRDCRKKWDWLESLKGRVQPKQEWSEEDEKTIRLLIAIIETNHKEDALFKASEISPIRYLSKNEVIERIKSLRPQRHWKPTEEQIEALRLLIDSVPNFTKIDYVVSLLNELLQLKNL